MSNIPLSLEPKELLLTWLDEEYVYSSTKFGDNQSESLRTTQISNNAIFAGQAATYWARMQAFRTGGAEIQAAQAAAKMASSLRSLWSTLRSMDRVRDTASVKDAIWLVDDHFQNSDYHEAKLFIDKPDFWETPIGLGASYLERHIRNHGLAKKFRLGQLIRAEQIMLDAADVAALQFDRTLEIEGNIPAPAQPSGYTELWIPTT
jgi:hypothetical protein